MVTMTPREALGITEPSLEPEKALTAEQLNALDTWPKSLGKKIRAGTASITAVEDYLQKKPIPSELKEPLLGFLFAQKARMALRDDRAKEAAGYAEQALAHDGESPANWLAMGAAQLWLELYDEATVSFESAFLTRKRFGAHLRRHLPMLLKSWSGCALLHALSGIIKQDLGIAEMGVKEYLRVLDEAKAQNLEDSMMVPVGKSTGDSVPPDLQADLDELELMVRLLSIDDPFEGWRELSKEISKVWPHDISVVDEIREQRQ